MMRIEHISTRGGNTQEGNSPLKEILHGCLVGGVEHSAAGPAAFGDLKAKIQGLEGLPIRSFEPKRRSSCSNPVYVPDQVRVRGITRHTGSAASCPVDSFGR